MASRGLTVVSTIPSSSTSHKSSRKSHQQLLRFGLTSSFRGTKLPVIPSSFNLVASNRRLSIVCNLPTTIEPVAADKKPKWSATAIKAFSMGVCEGLKFKYKATGTEALLMGIMIEGTSEASNFLRAHGFTLFEVRDATVKLRGIGDYYDPPPMDPPLSKRAQKALDWAVEAKLKSGESGELTTTHMLLGIWSVKESVGYKLLARLGLDDEKAKELAKTVCDGPIVAFTVFHNINCNHGFIYITSQGALKICQLPALSSYDNYWPVQKIPLKGTPHQVTCFPEKNLYPVIVSVPVLKPTNQVLSSLIDQEAGNQFEQDNVNIEGTYPVEEFEVRILEPDNSSVPWQTRATIPMQSSENALAVRAVTLFHNTGDETLLAIGTAYVQGEDVSGRGRVLLYSVEKISDNGQVKVSEVYSMELKGAISALASL